MIEAFADFFRQLAEDYPRWNFIFFHDVRQWNRIISGLQYTVVLSIACVIFSVVIGIVGSLVARLVKCIGPAYCSGAISSSSGTRRRLCNYSFSIFALGQFTPTVVGADGWTEVPLISNVGWGNHFFVVLCWRLQCRDIPGRDRSGAGIDPRGCIIARIYETAILHRSGVAAGLPCLVAGAQQQSGQSRQDDDAGDRDCRARVAL